MYTFKVTDNFNKTTDVLAAKQNIQNGDLILIDLAQNVVAAFSKGTWVNSIRTSTPESRNESDRPQTSKNK